jgi:transcriptional regulator with XRE-family HTH domain
MDKTVGEQIREWRTVLGLTQAELAAQVGVSVDVLGRWERGAQEPRYSELVALVNAGLELPRKETNHETE